MINSADKITRTSRVTANLRLGNRVASALLDEPLVAAARVATRPPPPGGYAPRIDRFGVDPGNRLVPGEDLIFTLVGTPGGAARVRVVGIPGQIDRADVAPGRYEGGYT